MYDFISLKIALGLLGRVLVLCYFQKCLKVSVSSRCKVAVGRSSTALRAWWKRGSFEVDRSLAKLLEYSMCSVAVELFKISGPEWSANCFQIGTVHTSGQRLKASVWRREMNRN